MEKSAFSDTLESSTYIDFHTHRYRKMDDKDIVEIASVHLGQPIPQGWYTLGMHPWWTEHVSEDDLATIREILLDDPACLALGEVGLDKLKGPNMDRQQDILKSLLDISTQVHKPVILHCVRAFHQLLELKKDFPQIEKWCIHGYSRHKTLAYQLLDQGFMLSIMPSKKMHPSYIDLIQSLPPDRFFLETDSMPETDIESIYSQVARLRGITIENLQQQLIQNVKSFFCHG